MKIAILLLILVFFLAVYDARVKRLPNGVTLPLLVAGLGRNFPGLPLIWLGCLLLFLAWYCGALGGGDAKLWMALLWLVPPHLGPAAVLAMAAVFGLTAGLQLLWRIGRGTCPWGVRGPGAWRTIPFALWLLVASV